jgi:hypothetical protein
MGEERQNMSRQGSWVGDKKGEWALRTAALC